MCRYENGHIIIGQYDTEKKVPVLEKDTLLKRWRIADQDLEKIILHGGLRRIYDGEGNYLYPNFSRIQDNFNPFKENRPVLSQYQNEYLKNIFHSIYQEMVYFALEDIEYADATYLPAKNQDKKANIKDEIMAEALTKLGDNPLIRKSLMIEHLKEKFPACEQSDSQWKYSFPSGSPGPLPPHPDMNLIDDS